MNLSEDEIKKIFERLLPLQESEQPIPLRLWSAAFPLVLSGELPSSMAQPSEGQRI